MIEITIKRQRDRVRKVRSIIESVGNKIGSVHFIKRSDGSKRKMSYRLHVRKPTYVKTPSGACRIKDDNNLITVFDCNTVRYNKKDRMNGRGGYKSIPLNGVYRICVNGQIYRIKSK